MNAAKKIKARSQKLAKSVLKHAGQQAIYNDTHVIDIIHRINVQRFGDIGETITNSHEITFNTKDVENPQRGDVFELGDLTLRLKSPVNTSKGLAVWAAV